MQLKKNTDLKIFEIWVSKMEKEKIDKKDKLNCLFELCNEYGYKPVVFVSGHGDIFENAAKIIKQKSSGNYAA